MKVFVLLLGPLTVVGLALGSQGCLDPISTPNPQNCVASGLPCEAGFVCNTKTQICEVVSPNADCIAQPSACTTAELCDAQEHRCLPRRFVIGQPDDHSNLNLSYGLSDPYAVKLFHDQSDGGKSKLAVAEGGSDRVLIWNDLPTTNRPADVVLGQQDLVTTTAGRVYGPQMFGFLDTPWSIASDGTRLLIAERNWDRISIWSPIPRRSGISQPLVPTGFWGQPSLAGYLAAQKNGGQLQVNALGLSKPLIFAEEGPGHGFYISDSSNQRVLVFDSVPSDPTTAPRWVLGQPDFTSSGARPPATGIGAPYGLFSDGTQLFVADQAWNRVLVYNLPITQNQPTPDLVIGQPDLTGVAVNRGGMPSASSLRAPADVVVTRSGSVRRLWVADAGNNRVLRYTLPSSTADLVLGQPNFTSASGNIAGNSGIARFYNPLSISSDGTHLAVAELPNNRVHIYNTLPTQNAQPSDVLLGQPNGSTSVPYMPPAVNGLQFGEPTSVRSDGTRLFVVDSGFNRVLIFNRIPKDGKTPPDVVLGQHDFVGTSPNQDGVSASSLSAPFDVCTDGTRLAVSDQDNNRVLIWNQIPTRNFAPADLVLGQPDMSSRSPSVSAQRLNEPTGVLFQRGSLWISDSSNNRVLRFDAPLATSAAATQVLGQPDMNSSTLNAGQGPSVRGLRTPGWLASDNERLLVADAGNWRVLIWNQSPTTDFQPADVAVGLATWNALYPSDDRGLSLNYAYGIHVDAGRLYVSSAWDNRLLVWNQLPTNLGTPSSFVLGQSDLANYLPNDAALASVDRLSYPMGIATVDGRLFIADRNNNRVVSTELPP